MERFFFNVLIGDTRTEDPDGSLCPDLASAKLDAAEALRGVAISRMKARKPAVDIAMEITDGTGSVRAVVSTRTDAALH